MKQLPFVLFTFLFATVAGADVTKVRVTSDNYRIVLTGQDALRLQATLGERSITSEASPLHSVSCLKAISRCEIVFKGAQVQSYESVQEYAKLVWSNGQLALPRNSSEQLLTAVIDDQIAEQVYAILPGPEVEFNLDQSAADRISGKTKQLDLARNEFFMSCQKVARSNGTGKKGFSCLVNAIVPSGRE